MSKAVTFHHMVEFVEEGNIFYLHLNIHDFRCAPLPREEIKILRINRSLCIRPRGLIWTK